MSSINRKTGWYGYTIDTTGKATNDDGETTTCIFGVNYAYHVNDVDVKVSNNANDWGALMGDGTIIPLSAPQVLYQHRTNAVVKFTMKTAYASNTPCELIYLADTAYISITDNPSANRPFQVHTATGKFAKTVDRYGATINDHGEVNKLIATIYYPYFVANHTFDIAKGAGCWSAQMGNGDIIDLSNPTVLAVNKDNAVVLFDMAEVYPSNSPCLLLANKETSIFTITPIADKFTFIPVTDIVDCPTNVIGGLTVDLSCTTVKPYDATNKQITWSIISGGTGTATLNGNLLYAKTKGTIKVRATIKDGTAVGTNKTKDFTITVIENKITIKADIKTYLKPIAKEINQKISIIADVVNELMRVQWYYTRTPITSISASTFASSNAQELPNGTGPTVAIPTSWTKGDYYIFCKLSSPEAPDVYSKVCHVHVIDRCTSFRIVAADDQFNKVGSYAATVNMGLETSKNFTVEITPEGSEVERLSWFILDGSTSTNATTKKENIGSYMANLADKELIDSDGVSTRHGCTVSDCHRWGDTFKLQAVGYCGLTRLENTITIKTDEFYPVKELTNLLKKIETSENQDQDTTLRATVVSTVSGKAATNQNITWEIVKEANNNAWSPSNKKYIHYQDPIHSNKEIYNTGATIDANNKITAKNPGWIKVRATIKNGLAPHDTHLTKENTDVINNVGYDFVYEYMIEVVQAFIPVEDMQLTSNTSGVSAGDRLRLVADPKSGTVGDTANSSKREYNFSLTSAGTTEAKLQGDTLIIPKQGTLSVRGRVPKGKMTNHKPGDDYTKDFSIVVTADGFVSVENVELTFTPEAHQISFNNKGEKVVSSTPSPEMFNSNNIEGDSSVVTNNIVITISPSNATNKDIKLSVVKPTEADRYERYDGEDTEFIKKGDIISEDVGGSVTLSGSTIDDRQVSVKYNAIKTIDTGIAQYFKLKIEIPNAINKTQKFEKTVIVNMTPLDLDIMYPVQDIILQVPKPNRALVPIMLGFNIVVPNNASIIEGGVINRNIIWNLDNTKIADETKRVNTMLIQVGTTEDGTPLTMVDWLKDIYTNDCIRWDVSSVYCYNWIGGILGISIEVPNATNDNPIKNPVAYGELTKAFKKSYTPEILDPYIAVKSIIIPFIANGSSGGYDIIQIPKDKPIVLDPILGTDGGIKYYNPDWDEEVPTFSVPTFSVAAGSDFTIGNSISSEVEAYHNGDDTDDSNIVNFTTVRVNNENTHGIINGTKVVNGTTNRVKVSVPSGTKETMVWYGNVQNSVPFEKTYAVQVVSYTNPAESGFSAIQNIAINAIKTDGTDWTKPSNTKLTIPIAILYDASGNALEIYDKYDMTWCCNSKSSEFTMSVNGKSMKKSAVTRIEFCTADSVKETIKNNVKAAFDSKSGSTSDKNTAYGKFESWLNSLTTSKDGNTNYRYFARNFTNLTQINGIPSDATHLEGFMQGCSRFNSAITIPASVRGDNCLKYFMRDCIAFNSTITFQNGCPNLATANGSMHGFLEGCKAYNKALSIPSTVTGISCMQRLLKDCTAFNSDITFPANASGANMLMKALEGCTSFNRAITLPKGIFTSNYAISHFLYGANNFKSNITLHAAPGIDSNGDSKYDDTDYPLIENEHSFGSKIHLSAIAGTGITFVCTETPETNGWDGANLLCRLTSNNYNSNDSVVYRNVHSANCNKCPYHSTCEKLDEERDLVTQGVLDSNHKVLK